jgi:signal transduction histidine kinase/integral membrane sensor domain MASE1
MSTTLAHSTSDNPAASWRPKLARPIYDRAAAWPALAGPIFVAALYLLGAEAAFLIGTLSDKIFAPFWPPNIVLFCALLMVPPRSWWLYVLATIPAHVIAELTVGMPASQMLVAFLTNWAVAILSAVAARHLLGSLPWFDSPGKTGIYIAITALATPALVALGGAFVPILGGGEIQHYWAFWAQWYTSNAVSSLALGSLALAWLSQGGRSEQWRSRDLFEASLLAVALLVVCALAFESSKGTVASGLLPAILYLPLPFILWSAIRFGARGASGAILVVAIALLWRALEGPNQFTGDTPEASVFAIQVFLIGLAVPTLLLGAAIEQTRRAERAVRSSEERMGFAASAVDVCLWHFEHQPENFWITDHGRRMFDLAEAQPLTRQSLMETVHRDDQQSVRAAIRAATVFDRLIDLDFRIVWRNGEVRWIRARARSERNEHGQNATISGTFSDITNQKAAERQLAQQRQDLAHLMRVSMLGELSGSIAHELTQPLMAILANAEAARLLVAKDNPDLDEVAAALDEIVSEDNRAAAIIQHMRGLLKKGESKFQLVDLNELVVSTLRLVHSELVARHVNHQCDLTKTSPKISGDPVQLQQVLLNLIMNAIEAMNETSPSRRIVEIRTETSTGGKIRIGISDRGTGVAPAHEEQVFQPFFTTKEHGLGLGLTICSSIVQSHGGTLELANNRGEGATATLILPGGSSRPASL